MNMTQPIERLRLLVTKALLGAACCWMTTELESVAGPISTSAMPTISIRIEEPNARTWRYTPSESDLRASGSTSGAKELAEPREFNILSNRTHLRVEELEFDPDPFVLNNVLVTNTTATTQSYSVFVGLPTSFAAPSVTSGNVRFSVIDGGEDGATLTTVGSSPIYTALVDGTSVATLQDAPYSLIAPAGSSAAAPLATFGPAPYVLPVTTDIGIELKFALSSGDTAAILSRFEVASGVIVPEPSAFALILPAWFVAIRRRRGRDEYPRLE